MPAAQNINQPRFDAALSLVQSGYEDLRKFPSLAARMAVVKEMLLQFAALLQRLANAHPRVTLINAQGLLAPVVQSWHNELHPQKAGFNAFADRFRQEIAAVFPGRVF